MDESLWSTRNVAEHAYCPRLFYYMEVEGIHLHSADTVQGVNVHRRVDSSSVASGPADDDPARPRSVRSLSLTSSVLGLTATLDLAEINGNSAVPVEYRKGRPRHLNGAPVDEDDSDRGPTVEPWPTDRVQVGLQSLLLEEAGYVVPHAVLYYAAEKRRVVVTVDQALKDEAKATLAAAKECARGPRPLPLVNDPRCPRCSLQPICLPDEVNLARGEGGVNGAKPKKLWPPRDDGIHIVAQENGAKIGVRGGALSVTGPDGRKLKEMPLAGVESLALLGSVQISTQAVQALAGMGIPIAYLSAAGRLVALVDPLDSVSAETRRAQVRRFDDPAACLNLSRALIAAKIVNQRKLLMRNCDGFPTNLAAALAEQANQSLHAGSLDALRGHEGQAAAIYFDNFAGMLKSELAAEFDANGRQRRPAPDPVNSCLSM